MSAISELAVSQLKSHKRRSAVICIAAVLTLVLYMTIISMTFALAESMQLSMMLAAGSRMHGSIDTRDFSLSQSELLDYVNKYPSVKDAFLVTDLGSYTDNISDSQKNKLYAFSSKDMLPEMFLHLTDGRFPNDSTEVVLNREIYPDAKVGDNITLSFTVIDYGAMEYKTVNHSFTVVGLSFGDTDRQLSAFTMLDETLVDETNAVVQVFINFKSSVDISGKIDALTESLSEYITVSDLNIFVNSAYIGANATQILNPQAIFFVVVIVSVIFLAAFLLIYNIYSIALTQDMQQLGLLSVVGTTYKQLKKLTIYQALILFTISLPVGVLLGYILGWRLMTPVFMSMSGEVLPYTFNWWIPVVSALLTVFTLCFSAARPLRRLRKYSPIQTVTAEPNQIKSRKVTSKSEANITPISLAVASVKREPKRLMVTSLSGALSILLFIFVGTLVETVAVIMERDIMISDIAVNIISDSIGGGMAITSDGFWLEDDLYNEIAALDGVESVGCVRYAIIPFKGTRELSDKAKAYTERTQWYTEQLDKLIEGNPDAIILGVSDELCKYIRVGRDENKNTIYYNGSELYDGDHILNIITDGESFGEPYDFFHLNEGDTLYSDSLDKNYKVITGNAGMFMPLSDIGARFYYDFDYPLFILPMSEFERQFPESKIASILVNTSQENESSVAESIKALADSAATFTSTTYYDVTRTYKATVRRRFDDFAELDTRLRAISISGYGLAALIFLIGILNMINSALTSVMQKKREYAMLESVGMTGKQLNLMILCENSVSSIISTLVLLVSIPIIRVMIVNLLNFEARIDLTSAVVMLILTFVCAIITSLVSYKMLAHSPVTERLKVE